MNKKKKSLGSKAAASAVAAVTAAGVMMGGAVSPADNSLDDGPDAIVQTVSMSAQTAVDAGGSGDGGTAAAEILADDEEKRGLHASARKAMRAAPLRVRAAAALPLWIAASVMIAALSSVWAGVLPPVASALLSWLCTAAAAALFFVLAVKTVLPDVPLKKILSRRNLLGIGVLCLVCAAADACLPLFWDDYWKLSRAVRVIGALICTGVPAALFLRRFRRKEPEAVEAEPAEEPAPEPEPEPTPEEKELASRRLVAELADSVCPRV